MSRVPPAPLIPIDERLFTYLRNETPRTEVYRNPAGLSFVFCELEPRDARHAQAAAMVSAWLGRPTVPAYAVQFGERTGTLRLWFDGQHLETETRLGRRRTMRVIRPLRPVDPAHQAQYDQLRVVDHALSNPDRTDWNSGNIIVPASDPTILLGIDDESAFCGYPPRVPKYVPEALHHGIRTMVEQWPAYDRALAPYVDSADRRAFHKRLERLSRRIDQQLGLG